MGSEFGDDNQPPFIAILDTAHLMDGPSWELLDSLKNQCYRLAIVLCMQTDDADNLKIHPDSRAAFEKVWYSGELEDMRIIDMPTLEAKSLHTLLKQNAASYQKSFSEEIAKMTEIVDRSNTIKTDEMGKNWTNILTKKYVLENVF